MQAGKLDMRVAFDEATGTVTPAGGQVTVWTERIAAVWAGFVYLRGTESVIAARLVGRQPVVVRVRASAATRAIRTDWRMRDLRGGTIYAVRSIIAVEGSGYIDLTCESGVMP